MAGGAVIAAAPVASLVGGVDVAFCLVGMSAL